MNKTIGSKKIGLILFCIIFVLIFVCNCFTDLISDDFNYMFNFKNGERITNFFQIFGSLKGHSLSMNGRLTAHFFAQTVLLMPKWIFNLINSLIFTLLVFLIEKIADVKNKRNYFLIGGIFCAIWILSPAFGQAFLWLDGSCNYLWSYFWGALFILPFAEHFAKKKKIGNIFLKCLFLLVSFIAGSYSENTSAAFICAAVLILLSNGLYFKTKPYLYEIFSVIIAFAGYITIYLAPAQWKSKSAEFSWHSLRDNFIDALNMYKKFALVLFVFVIAFVIACFLKVHLKKLILSLIFLMSSLVANFMMIFAVYYEERSAVSSLILLLIASTILLSELYQTKYKTAIVAIVAVLAVSMCYHYCVGLNDIYDTHRMITANEEIIYESKAKGDLDVELKNLIPETKYSPAYGVKYLGTKVAEDWPNVRMAEYYGLNSLIGY